MMLNAYVKSAGNIEVSSIISIEFIIFLVPMGIWPGYFVLYIHVLLCGVLCI